MMRRILGVLGLIMMIGVAAAIPVNRAEAQTEITASEAVILNQALGVLAATLRLMNERVQSQNIPPEKVQELTATLGKISFSLLTLSRSAGESNQWFAGVVTNMYSYFHLCIFGDSRTGI